MTYKVLVVDDSIFFQSRLKDIINEHPDLEVAGFAANGNQAVEQAIKLSPDVISMDYEMPYLNGACAIRNILSALPKVPIIMFSSMTYEGAKVTLECMDAGAVDFIPKNFAEVANQSLALKNKLHDTFIAFACKARADAVGVLGHNAVPRPRSPPTPSTWVGAPAQARISQLEPVGPNRVARKTLRGGIELIVIGASTGGPVALAQILMDIPKGFKYPIVVIQHMPKNFTAALAERLDKQCEVSVVEASNGDKLLAGRVYIAPGGRQCIFDRAGNIQIYDADQRVTYKPSVDVAFASAANIYGAKVLGIVLTGMGADGCEGARLLKQKGGFVWGQDRASCVVYGMPKAVADAGLTDRVMTLSGIGHNIVSQT